MQMEGSSVMQNEQFQLQNVANDCKWLQMARKSGRFQLPNAANSMENWHGQESKKH